MFLRTRILTIRDRDIIAKMPETTKSWLGKEIYDGVEGGFEAAGFQQSSVVPGANVRDGTKLQGLVQGSEQGPKVRCMPRISHGLDMRRMGHRN